MNKRITRLGIGLVICYLALFVQLNRIQVFGAKRLTTNPENFRAVQRDFDRPRGIIASADQVVLARSVETPESSYERLRQYPEGDLFANVTGFFSLEFGAEGAEDAFNEELAGSSARQRYQSVQDLLVDRDHSGDVILTVRKDVQAAAKAALGERRGSVVVMDPRSGAVLALWSWPSYDPNLLSSHDLAAVKQNRAALLAAPDQPMLARSYRERYPPGSTFKVVTAAAGLQSGRVTLEAPVFPPTAGYIPPASSQPIANFGGATCGGNLAEILRVSCNTAFAALGAEVVGPQQMVASAADFGFNVRTPFDLAGAASPVFPTDFGKLISGAGGAKSVYENSAALAQASIGQNDVAASPLAMAVMIAAVANDGKLPSPHVLAEVRDAQGRVIRKADNAIWRKAVEAPVAAELRRGLEGVVANGTAKGLALAGWTVGAKTGTAQLGNDRSTNAWVVGYAGPAGRPATIAFAVLVEADATAGQQTGGGVAVPIAAALLPVALFAQK